MNERPSIAHTGDFHRILTLPRRVWSDADLASLAASLTEILKMPGGTMSLRPVQALALHDAGIVGGLFGAIGVGEGKTLPTMLLPVALGASRPLLLLPGGLIENASRARVELARHWRIPTSLRIMSYDVLSRVDAANELEVYAPDAIICDEAHRLKNRGAAVTRRVERYMTAHMETKFCALSGSIMDKSLEEFAHLLLWALKWNAPIPYARDEVTEWAEALDYGGDIFGGRRPGALLELCSAEERATYTEQVAARHGFRRRLTETPGVVATVGEGLDVKCSIYLREIRQKVAPIVETYFDKLRNQMLTPDDWELETGVEVWQHAQELALGLHYVWDPRPPIEWRMRRSAWAKFVRETISRSRKYDSELQVAQACDAGALDATALNAWREIEPSFTPNVVPIWHDDFALKTSAEWMSKPGIVWTEHRFFAERLAAYTGCRYFGAGGFDEQGAYIEDASPTEAVIASIDANREGKNLQKLWNRNLVVCPPKSAAWWEQLIARTHRTGQTADEVIVDVVIGCRENFDAVTEAIAGARAIQEMTGKRQKLLMADVTLSTEAQIDALRTPRWIRRSYGIG